MTEHTDDDDDEFETFRPAPHPDDRLWRHPSEVAAMHAAQANAETVKVPVVVAPEPTPTRARTGLKLVAGVAAVGAVALTLGVLSSSSTSPVAQTSGVIGNGITTTSAALSDSDTSRDSSSNSDNAGDSEVSPVANAVRSGNNSATELSDEQVLGHQVFLSVSPSIPRIQAATDETMREGSGFFVTDDGHIATSASLIANAEYVLAWTSDGQRWKADVVATDAVSDIAVLRIDSDQWPSLSLASETNPWAGQHALAFDHHAGYIAMGEIIDATDVLVRFDQPAAVPGSALVDDTSSVVAMVIGDGSNQLATPAWIIEDVAIDLISAGATTHTWLGVLFEATDDDLVVVDDVVAGSPADQAGIRTGDEIVAINGADTPNFASLFRHVQQVDPGDDAVLTISRNGNRRLVLATIEELPQ